MALVYAQHDLGTMLVMLVCAAAVLVVAGLKPVHIVVLLMLARDAGRCRDRHGQGPGVPARPAHRLHRPEDRRDRDPDCKRRPSSTCAPSKTAIASGGLTGTGLFEGLQTKNGFVPEQHTDFIFTAVGEELGFVGGATLIALYALLAWRLWRIALLSSDFFGTLVAIGVLAMFAIQVFENIGMTMGIMPITGHPAPVHVLRRLRAHRLVHRHRPRR